MKGLHSHKDYNLVKDLIAKGRAIILSSQLLLTIILDKTIEVAYSSLKDYFFDSSTQFNILAFHFQESCIQCIIVKVVLSYLSFECFTDELSNKEQCKHHFLEYVSHQLVYHSSKSGDLKDIAKNLITFFNTQQGQRQLQQLSDTYELSHGYFQVMQS